MSSAALSRSICFAKQANVCASSQRSFSRAHSSSEVCGVSMASSLFAHP